MNESPNQNPNTSPFSSEGVHGEASGAAGAGDIGAHGAAGAGDLGAPGGAPGGVPVGVPGDVALETKSSKLIEHTGIEIIAESERTAKPRDLFWPWFAANVSVFSMSYGTWLLGFGISFWQALIVGIIGTVISFFLCGLVAIAGKRGSAPTMVLSRAAFGVKGQKIPGIISWMVSIGWETFLAILAVLATATVFERLGLPGGTGTKIIAAILIAALIVTASVLGYHTIMKLQSIITWATGAMTIVFLVLVIPSIDFNAVLSIPTGSWGSAIGALVMVMTGLGLGWINIAADWSRYQKRDASDSSIIFYNTLGGAVAPIFLVSVGLLLAGTNPELASGIDKDPIGTLASLLPTWVLIPFWLTAVLALVSGAVLGIYSSGLTLISLGINIPRPTAAAIDGIILTIGTIWVVFFAQNFIEPFQSFLITLGVPLAAWAGIMISDTLLRKYAYDDESLFDPRGIYGAWDPQSLITFFIFTVIGWGLVINNFAEAASWNNWQGYLMEPLGIGKFVDDPAGSYWEGTFAYANLGVFISLVGSFVVTYVIRAKKVRHQENRE